MSETKVYSFREGVEKVEWFRGGGQSVPKLDIPNGYLIVFGPQNFVV